MSEPIAILQLKASGTMNGQERKAVLRISHEDMYAMTAIPVVAFLLQYLDGSLLLTPAGLKYQGLSVEPLRFLEDVEKLGASVHYEESSL